MNSEYLKRHIYVGIVASLVWVWFVGTVAFWSGFVYQHAFG